MRTYSSVRLIGGWHSGHAVLSAFAVTWFALFGCTPPDLRSTATPPQDHPGMQGLPDPGGGGGGGGGGESHPDPDAPWGPTIHSAVAPVPISGGTLLVTRDGKTAIAADPDRDQVSFVDLVSRTVRSTAALDPGDEPGRLAEDGSGRVHVALRRGGAIVTFDAFTGARLGRRAVCPAPRGLPWDGAADVLHVACAGGELVTLHAAPAETAPLRTLHLESDLRDVVVRGSSLFVTRFRAAEVLVVSSGGDVALRLTPPRFSARSVRGGEPFSPGVAWRAREEAGGGIIMVFQRGQDSPIGVTGSSPAAYYGGEASIVHASVAILRPGDDTPVTPAIARGVLPVDLATSPNGEFVAIACAGNDRAVGKSHVMVLPIGAVLNPDATATGADPFFIGGQAVAVAYTPSGQLLVQTRQPAALFIEDVIAGMVELSKENREDTGHRLFHENPGPDSDLACASCHPEGGEDGRVWKFVEGPRRTQSLRGGILATAPFHWDGKLASVHDVVAEVFVKRMSGPTLRDDRVMALQQWIDAIPLLAQAPSKDAAAVARGKAIFSDPHASCSSCHGGALLTNNTTIDVGTGGAFQVPSLRGLAVRAPYLHDGCAITLRDRFGLCGGGASHGNTARLTSSELDDLIAFLTTL